MTNKSKWIVRKAIIVLLCSAFGYIVYTQVVLDPKVDRATAYGATATDFTLKDLEGDQHKLTDYAGKGVMINFWATYCPPCEKEMPAIERAYQDYQNQGIEVLAVNVEEPMRIVNSFISQKNISFPILLDRHGEASSSYEVLNLPVTFFINEEGQIVEKVSGEMTEEMVRANMEKIKPNGTSITR